MAPRLSVAIIALNEERNLSDCLASVAFADEIVVVDGGSQDRTREIAQNAGARVIEATDWQGFGVQKNRALDACTGDWILAIDADERVSAELRDEIALALRAPQFDVYEIPRSSYYCGRFMQHSGWWPDFVRRLFKQGAARFSDAPVHESLQTDRSVGRLVRPLEHWSFRTMEDVLDKVNRYSSLSAPIVIQRGGRPTLLTQSCTARSVPSDLHSEARFSRWSARVHAGHQQCRRVLLPVREGDALDATGAGAAETRATAPPLMLISVVVATYNRPDALAAVLRSLAKQDDQSFEIVVADDGSGPETAVVTEQAQSATQMRVSHVWQQDLGFRLAAARNRATANARGDILIYLDGDCIVGRHFVRAHRSLLNPAGARRAAESCSASHLLGRCWPSEWRSKTGASPKRSQVRGADSSTAHCRRCGSRSNLTQASGEPLAAA